MAKNGQISSVHVRNVKPTIQEDGKDPGGSKQDSDTHWKSPTSTQRVKHSYRVPGRGHF